MTSAEYYNQGLALMVYSITGDRWQYRDKTYRGSPDSWYVEGLRVCRVGDLHG